MLCLICDLNFGATAEKSLGTVNVIIKFAFDNKMETPGPRTRSRARAEPLVTVQPGTKAVGDALPAGGLSRQSSLIPAYHYEDTIEDISLECMMGTPFDVDHLKSHAKQAIKPVLIAPKSAQPWSAPPADEATVEEALPTPTPDTEPASPTVKQPVDNVAELPSVDSDPNADEEEVEHGSPGFVLASALDSLTLGPDNEDKNLCLDGPLRGMPAPIGGHIRFDDDGTENASPRQKVFLRGVPEPLGKHTKFEECSP